MVTFKSVTAYGAVKWPGKLRIEKENKIEQGFCW